MNNKKRNGKMITRLDADAQPLNRNFSARRLANRTLDEFIGLCKGILADEVLNVDEVLFLGSWLKKSREVVKVWPCNILAERIAKIMSDGVIVKEEKQELFDLLTEITGFTTTREVIDKSTGEIIEGLSHMATLLPIDKPAPSVVFREKSFCLTGKFFYGSRKKCEEEIVVRGGQVSSSVTRMTDYLVLGFLGSSDWKHSTHGNKIKKGVILKSEGCPLAIVSEEHWTKFF